MTIIDSHCHPQYLIKDGYTQRNFIDDCQELKSYLMVSVKPDDIDLLQSIANECSKAFLSAGIHPSHAHEHNFTQVETIVEQPNTSLVALGETGLDYYHTKEHVDIQHQYFHRHLELGAKHQLPIIVHTRSAGDDTLAILAQHPGSRGVIHCFTETKEFAKKALDLGFYISFSGIITFKKAQELREVVKYCPLDRILSETDAPFLAPVPHRGKDNHPKWVKYVVDEIAALKEQTPEHMAQIISKNTVNLFDKIK